MIISKLYYCQNVDAYDEWYLKDLNLGMLNLITGRNAVGKTRTVSIISHLAGMLSGKQPRLSNGYWDLLFATPKGPFNYRLHIQKQQIEEEFISQKGRTLLDRHGDKGDILHEGKSNPKLQPFNPPNNKLTIQVRRDLKELVYLEELAHWAENLHTVSFSHITPGVIPMLLTPRTELGDLFTPDLGLAPYMLEELLDDTTMRQRILKDLNQVGYKIKDIDVAMPNIPNAPKEVRIIRILESGLKHTIDQYSFSQGMLRVVDIVIAINYLLSKKGDGTFIGDDFAEGLDFERATKLTKVVFNRLKSSKVQLIVTSNDRFLMNAVDIKHWNILERKEHTVKSFNYINRKKQFSEFARVGLNNFDFFANRLYKG